MININNDHTSIEMPLTAANEESREKKPLLVKEVANAIFIALASVFAAVGVAGAVAFAFIPPVGLTLLLISMIGLSALNLIKLWELVTPHLPEPLRAVANQIQSFGREILAVISQIFVAPIDLTKKDPKTFKEIDPNETPTLLIHGFLGSSNNWIYHRERLVSAGYKNVFTINLGDPRLPIEEYAKKVDEKIKEIKTLTGRSDIRFVCHSMGGLVAREWHYNHNVDTKVRDIVTIGSPLNGTHVANATLGLSECGKQMYPDSPFVKAQQERASQDTETNYYHIGSNTDLVILPNSSAHAGAAPNAKLDTLDCTGHVGYLFSDTTADLLINYFKTQEQMA